MKGRVYRFYFVAVRAKNVTCKVGTASNCTVGVATDQRQAHPATGSSIPYYGPSHEHTKYSATSGDNVPCYRSPRQGAEIVRRVERRNDLVPDTPPRQSVASGAHVDQRRVDEDHELTPFLHLDHHSKQDTPTSSLYI